MKRQTDRKIDIDSQIDDRDRQLDSYLVRQMDRYIVRQIDRISWIDI